MVRAGKATPIENAVGIIDLSCDAARCTACDRCHAACPVGCITTDEAGIPRFGPGCTGCYACYNACDQGALSAIYTPNGVGRYPGPSREMRQLFGPRRV